MLNKLTEQINSFSNQTRLSVHSVLAQSAREKSEIGNLIKKVSSFISSADYAPKIINQLEVMQKEFIIDMFRDIDLRIKTQFDISNSMSMLSASMNNVFGGELAKIESDLDYLNAYVDNYSFISGEDDLYNFSFIENFDNESNSYINENSSLTIPDRDGINFSQKMLAKVDQPTGKLKFSATSEATYDLVDSFGVDSIEYETNFPKEYISSDNGINKLLNNINSKSWSISVKSPFVIKNSLLDSEKYIEFKNNIATESGAEVAVNIHFSQSTPMSRIRISPNVGSSIEISQIILEIQDSQEGSLSSSTLKKKAILKNRLSIDKNSDIDFESTYLVKSVSIILFQRNYIRNKITAVQSEINSKMLASIMDEIKKERMSNHDKLQEYVIRFFLRDTEKTYLLRNKKIYSYNYTGYYPSSLSSKNFGVIEKLSKGNYYSDIESLNKFKNTSLLSNIIFSIISYSLGARLRNQISSTYVESKLQNTTRSIFGFRSNGLIPPGDSNIVDKNIHFFDQNLNSIDKKEATAMLSNLEPANSYEYNLSIKSISFFKKSTDSYNTGYQNKSFFVSKTMPINGRPIKTKMLADYFKEANYLKKDKTSVEFSVCIKDDISVESNWIPVIPYNEDQVSSEKLILNSNGEGALRLEPLLGSIVLYENSIAKPSGSLIVNGKNVKVLSFNDSNIYYVSYTPKYMNSAKEVQLHSSAIGTPILASVSFNGSNGEYFSSTGSNNRVRLSYVPYIDNTKMADATYTQYTGVITSAATSFGNYDNSFYSPVKIQFFDGSTATNITNYLQNNNQAEVFYDTENTLFIHHGDTLVFNKSLNKPFRVIYQYVPDSFRYRIIMRSLSNDLQDFSVDRLIFKFSTENQDNVLLNLTKYDNLFKNKIN